jgi:hypothetical protein
MKKSKTTKLSLNRETVRALADTAIQNRIAGAATAGIECSGVYNSCGSQWPNCNFSSTCPQFTGETCYKVCIENNG